MAENIRGNGHENGNIFVKFENMKKASEIKMKLQFDPEYINKSKKSICKCCIHNLGWEGEIYECKLANEGFPLTVNFEREGVFHTKIITCNRFSKLEFKIGDKILVKNGFKWVDAIITHLYENEGIRCTLIDGAKGNYMIVPKGYCKRRDENGKKI